MRVSTGRVGVADLTVCGEAVSYTTSAPETAVGSISRCGNSTKEWSL